MVKACSCIPMDPNTRGPGSTIYAAAGEPTHTLTATPTKGNGPKDLGTAREYIRTKRLGPVTMAGGFTARCKRKDISFIQITDM